MLRFILLSQTTECWAVEAVGVGVGEGNGGGEEMFTPSHFDITPSEI